MKAYYVYMMTNRSRVVLYTGVRNDRERRVWEHQKGTCKGFTTKYRVSFLVYHETYHDIDQAITREKEMKGWRRRKKNARVETLNPRWNRFRSEVVWPPVRFESPASVATRPVLRLAALRRLGMTIGESARVSSCLTKVVRFAAHEPLVRQRPDFARFDQNYILRVLYLAFDEEKRLFRDDQADALE